MTTVNSGLIGLKRHNQANNHLKIKIYGKDTHVFIYQNEPSIEQYCDDLS